MKRLSELRRTFVLLLCAVGLGGCGYASSPGMVVETKQYSLSDKTRLIVTRHLDDWRTGSLFTFEWYVAKCKSSSERETILLQDMVLRGTFSSEISQERIRIVDGEIGYAYFQSVVVFDERCNKISYFDPWRTSAIDPSRIAPGYRTESVRIEQSGHGSVRLSWALKEGGMRELVFRTNDFGVHWTLPNSDMDVVKEVRVEPPAADNISTFGEITDKLKKSEYVVMGGELVRRPQAGASTSTFLSHDQEFKVLKKGIELAKTVAIVRDGAGVVIVEWPSHYEIIVANQTSLGSPESRYVYAAKVLVNKKADALAQWLSGD